MKQKNFKKKLLSAVAVLSSPFLFATLMPSVFADTIQFGDETSVVSEGDVKGYAVGGETVYAADVGWADMTFIFDNGEYDEEKNKVVCSFPDTGTDQITSAMVEKGSEGGTIRRWYGFNGYNNRIVVLNRSNADIWASYSATPQSGSVGKNVSIDLYSHTDNSNGGKSVSIDSGTGSPTLPDDSGNRFGGEGNAIENTEKMKINGSAGDGKAYIHRVFINITGTPSESFQKLDGTENQLNGKIGTITVTLTKNDPNQS